MVSGGTGDLMEKTGEGQWARMVAGASKERRQRLPNMKIVFRERSDISYPVDKR